MANHLLLLPLIATITGFCLGLCIRARLLKTMPAYFTGVAAGLVPSLLSGKVLRTALPDSVPVTTLLPMIEAHIDDFLRNRLGKAIPMVGMFIGEKTIAEMKQVFMQELTAVLPQVMDKYAEELLNHPGTRELLINKITASEGNLSSVIQAHLRRKLAVVPFWSALAGLAIGLLQVLILLWI